MPDIKALLSLRVTATKKFLEGGEEDLTKRLSKLAAKRGQGAADMVKWDRAIKTAVKVRPE